MTSPSSYLSIIKLSFKFNFLNSVVLVFKSCHLSPGVPNWMQFSSVRTKSPSLSLMTWRLLDFSMFFSHLLAWP